MRKKILVVLLAGLLLAGAAGAGINLYVKYSGGQAMAFAVDSPELFLEPDALADLTDFGADCILILGASVRGDAPSKMLKDRLDVGIALYQAGVAPKLLLSGDNGQQYYNEVAVMLQYALDAGVPARDIFLDHAGFSTYESMYRAGAIFEVKKAVIVTQGYHLYRALYDARGLGVDAVGVASDQKSYGGQSYRDLREIAARIKDFFMVLTKPEPTYLGEAIPIGGDGRSTH